jgi:type IV secretory pathway VirB4 component
MAAHSASQHFVPVKDIKEDVVILKDGQMCMILLASSINFALKSSDEQQAILSQFQSFLNSLDFSFQIYVQSRRLDIRPYLELLRTREPLQDNDLMRIQLREYIEFINAFTTQVDIMTKNFYVVVPYTPSGLETTGFTSFLKPKSDKKTAREDKFYEDRTQLEQRVSVVTQGLARIGINTQLLGPEQSVGGETVNTLTELFYHIFNPDDLTNAPKQ